jgi:hypothetical protein
LVNVLSYKTGVEANDAPFTTSFPFVSTPWSGDGKCGGELVNSNQALVGNSTIGLSPRSVYSGKNSISGYELPNPFSNLTQIKIDILEAGNYDIRVYDISGRTLEKLYSGNLGEGMHTYTWGNGDRVVPGQYFVRISNQQNQSTQILKLSKI